MMKPNATIRSLQQILDSDDELPDSYDEVPEIPAYLDDDRFEQFEPVNFGWINETSNAPVTPIPSITPSSQKESQSLSKTILPQQNVVVDKGTKMILVSKGTLSKRDIFFIKNIEEYCSDKTLLWFIDFMRKKSALPIQRSCLVVDIIEDHCTAALEPFYNSNLRYYLKTVARQKI